jgi:hypothetical protein
MGRQNRQDIRPVLTVRRESIEKRQTGQAGGSPERLDVNVGVRPFGLPGRSPQDRHAGETIGR